MRIPIWWLCLSYMRSLVENKFLVFLRDFYLSSLYFSLSCLLCIDETRRHIDILFEKYFIESRVIQGIFVLWLYHLLCGSRLRYFSFFSVSSVFSPRSQQDGSWYSLLVFSYSDWEPWGATPQDYSFASVFIGS